MTASQKISEEQLPYQSKFLRAKFFVVENFRYLAKISSLFPNENFYFNMEKGIIWKKVNSIIKPLELVECLSYIKHLMVAFNNWREIHTVILRKYYVTMSLCKYYVFMNMFQRKSLKLQYKPKQTMPISIYQ